MPSRWRSIGYCGDDLSSVEIPYEASGALCIRVGFLALRGIADYFDISDPQRSPISSMPITVIRANMMRLFKLEEAGVPLKADREKAWMDFAGWRVNYYCVSLALCSLVMAPQAPWLVTARRTSQDSPLLFKKKKKHHLHTARTCCPRCVFILNVFLLASVVTLCVCNGFAHIDKGRIVIKPIMKKKISERMAKRKFPNH